MSSSRCARRASSATRAKWHSRRFASAPALKPCSTSARYSSFTGRMKTSGLLKPAELAKLVEQGEIETVVVGFTDHYGRMLGKRYDAEMFVDGVVKDGAHACDYLLTVDMEMERVPGY